MSQEKPEVTIEMVGGGTIKIELEPEIAPNTVRNFIHLAEKKFYDRTIFHRVIPGFMIQGGCPRGDGTGGPGYRIKGEFNANDHPNPISHERGVLSMARARDFDSAGSQFFITVDDASHLDGEYAAFGRVVEGMETADHIAGVTRNPQDRPMEEQQIRLVKLDTGGVKYAPPEKLKKTRG